MAFSVCHWIKNVLRFQNKVYNKKPSQLTFDFSLMSTKIRFSIRYHLYIYIFGVIHNIYRERNLVLPCKKNGHMCTHKKANNDLIWCCARYGKIWKKNSLFQGWVALYPRRFIPALSSPIFSSPDSISSPDSEHNFMILTHMVHRPPT